MGFVLFSVEVSNHLFLSLCPTLEPTIGLFSAETLMDVIKCLMNYKKKCHYLLTYYGLSLEDICPDDIKTISQMYLVRKVFNIKTWLW